jgi:predicted RNase H-like HicB family nuclease
MPYRMVIEWSQEDGCYLVHLPDFYTGGQYYTAHGDTYQEAALHGQEVLETFIEIYQEEGRPLPTPATLQIA